MSADTTEPVPYKGLPMPTRREIVRFELKQVPAAAARRFLQGWGERRVPDKPGIEAPGIPTTHMPVTTELRGGQGATLTGLRLIFDASPTDAVDVNFYPLAGGSSAVIMTRVEGGTARAGGLGPQIAALISSAETKIRDKLQQDVNAYARNYTRSRRAGALPDEEEEQPSAAADSSADFSATSSDDFDSYSDSSSSFGTVSEREPQRQHSAPLPESFFPEAQEYADPIDAYPGGREAFNMDAFGAYEEARTGIAADGSSSSSNATAAAAGVKGFEGVLQGLYAANSSESQLAELFTAGAELAAAGQADQMKIPAQQDLVQLEVMLGPGTGTRGGIDIFTGPPAAIGGEFESRRMTAEESRSVSGSSSDSSSSEADADANRLYTMYDEDDVPVLQLTAAELEAIDPDNLELQMARLDGLMYELGSAPAEMRNTILSEYSDVLLDEYYVLSMRARIPRLETEEQRALMQLVNARAVVLVQQLAGMKQAQEVQELEKIRSICETAMEDMSKLPDKVRSMKPLLNADFVAYLGYAIDKERAHLRKLGFNPDKEPSRWLQVLAIIKRGVFAELEKDVALDVEAIHYVLRMEHASERRKLLEFTINDLPSMDVRGFRKVGRNIVQHIAARTAGVDDALRSKVAEFGELLEELLTDARVEALSKESDDWAANRVADRNAVLKAARRDRRELGRMDPATLTGSAPGAALASAAAAALAPAKTPEEEDAEDEAELQKGLVDLSEFYRMQRAEAIEDGEEPDDESQDTDWGAWNEDELEELRELQPAGADAAALERVQARAREPLPWAIEAVPAKEKVGSYQKPGSPLPPGYNSDPSCNEVGW